MRIKYIGLDNQARIAETNRLKFLPDGFDSNNKRSEGDESIQGPIIVAHVYRTKGGRRLIMQVPPGFSMAGAQRALLENNWLDLSECTMKAENLY